METEARESSEESDDSIDDFTYRNLEISDIFNPFFRSHHEMLIPSREFFSRNTITRNMLMRQILEEQMLGNRVRPREREREEDDPFEDEEHNPRL